jgi:hypothetical protein
MANKQMLFLTESKKKDEKITVSARIDKSLHAEFEEAKKKAQSKGLELRLTSLIENAIKLAVKEVEKITEEK